MEMIFLSRLLHQRIAAINKRLAVAVPVDNKCGDAHRLCMANLAAELGRVLRGVADRDVLWMPKPRLIQGDDLRRVSRSSVLQARHGNRAGAGASMGSKKIQEKCKTHELEHA